MTDLNTLIADLDVLSEAYAKRAHLNGPGHADNAYLWRQADNFHDAKAAIQEAIWAASHR